MGDVPKPALSAGQLRLIEQEVNNAIVRLAASPKPASTRAERLWAGLNSGFVLWLLASVVVGGGTAVFAKLSEERKAANEHRNAEERVNLEMSLRIPLVEQEIARRESYVKGRDQPDGKSPDTWTGGGLSWMGYEPGIFSPAATLFQPAEASRILQPQFAQYSFRSLMVEALFLCNDPHQKRAVSASLDHLEAARRVLEHHDFWVKTLELNGQRPPEIYKEELEMARQVEAHCKVAFHFWRDRATVMDSEIAEELAKDDK